MLIWSGLGFCVFVIMFGCSFIMEFLVESITGNNDFYQQESWPLAIALTLAGVTCWFLGKYLNKNGEQILIDKETGEEIILKNARHRFFFIKM